ncbi:MAG: ankyrin repeat domain-containing protein [Armatimonadota bacterium]
MDRYQELRTRAAQLIQQENWAEALVVMNELTRIWPESHIMAYNRGLVHWKLGDLLSAETWLKQTLTLQPDYQLAVNASQQIAMEIRKDYFAKVSSCMSVEDWSGTLSLLGTMSIRWPGDPQCLFFTAIAQHRTGEFEPALAILKQLTESVPGNQQIINALTEVQESIRRRDEEKAQLGSSEQDSGLFLLVEDEENTFTLVEANENEAVPVELVSNTEIDRGDRLVVDIESDEPYGGGGVTALINAASHSQIDTVKLLIARGVDINGKDTEGWTSLHWAAQNGDIDIVELLVTGGADVNSKANDDSTALNSAAAEGHADIVKLLMENGADVSNRNDKGATPLHHAIYEGHTDIALLLIAGGADITAKNDSGFTPLHQAAFNNRVEIAKLLVENRANINAKADNGWTPLHVASHKGFSQTVQELLNGKADINARDNKGNTPLHMAAMNGCVTTVELLISNGADINGKSDDGHVALHWAATKGSADTVKVLIESRADVHKKTDKGVNSLHYTSAGGPIDIIRLLIDAGADVNEKEIEGWTPLHIAAENGHADIVELLLDSGADINARKNDGATALIRAAGERHENVVYQLIERGADVNITDNTGNIPNFLRQVQGRLAQLETERLQRMIQEKRAGLTSRQSEEFATQSQCDSQSANDDAQVTGEPIPRNTGDNPAHVINSDRPEIGDSPLCSALRNRQSTLLRTLLRDGVDVNQPDNDGRLPLLLACQWHQSQPGKEALVAIIQLLEYGAITTADTTRYIHDILKL